MATALQHISECPVCLLTFEDPKVLPCDHSLCSNCVDGVKKGTQIKCPVCNTTHSVTSLRADFRLAQFLDALKEKQEEAQPIARKDADEKCRLCFEKAVAFWCENCQMWICKTCKTTHLRIPDCKDHQVTTLAVKNREAKVRVDAESAAIKRVIDTQERNIQTIENELTKLEVSQIEALEATDQLRRKILKDINDFFDSIDAKIIAFIQTNLENLEKERQELTKQNKEIKVTLENLQKVVAENASQLVTAGTSILQDAKKLAAKKGGESLHVEQVQIKVKQGIKWDVSLTAQLSLSGGGITFGSHVSSDAKLSHLIGKRFKRQKSVALDTIPRSVRLIDTKLWCCEFYGIIQIYDQDLVLQNTLSNRNWGNVYDVAVLPNGTLVLACSEGLFSVKADSEEMSRVDSGDFTCVVLYDEKIFSYNQSTPELLCYTLAFQKLWTRQLNFKRDSFVTFRIRNNKIFAASRATHRIHVMSFTAQVLNTFGQPGRCAAGELHEPYLCQDDFDARLLIADYRNNRMQIMDKDGTFSIVNMSPHMDRSGGAVSIGNKLFVVSGVALNAKLSLYTCG